MTNKELAEKWESFGNCDFDKTLYQEYVTFCNYASKEEFDNYFRIKEVDNYDFFSLLDFFYNNDCFNMMFRLLRDNRERLVIPDVEAVADIELKDHIDERMKRFIM